VWGRQVRAHPELELAAVVDVDAATLDRAGTELELDPNHRFGALADALDADRPDAVIVATSEEHHVEPCEVALDRGLAVLVEKPFATTLADAVALVELAERRGAPLLVGQQYRYMRYHRALRKVLEDGAIGRVGMVVCHYYHGSDHLRPAHAAMRDTVMWGPVVHHLDALRYSLGEPITGICAQTFSMPWSRLPEGASIETLLTFGDEIRATYTATYESSGHERFERGQEHYLRLVGERGTLHVIYRWLFLCRPGRLPRPIRRGPRPITEEHELLDQLHRAVTEGVAPDSSGRDNLATIAAIEACGLSSRERRWVDPREVLAEALALGSSP
jgi:predicted dehydrogenase